MRLQLVKIDARDVRADVQFVKHFAGLIGGAEARLDNMVNGDISRTFSDFSSSDYIQSQLVKVPDHIQVGCKNLLVLRLGDIDQFSAERLKKALIHGIETSLQNNFIKIATPIMGISDNVGLSIEQAYPITLKTILQELSNHNEASNIQNNIKEVLIFDYSQEKVSYFRNTTSAILHELGMEFEQISESIFEIKMDNLLTRQNTSDDSTIRPSHGSTLQIQHNDKSKDLVKILFLSAHPLNTTPLQIDEEIRAIDEALLRAKFRDRFEIQQHWAIRYSDLQELFLRHSPDIVHFSGHGSQKSEIIVQNENGENHPISVQALSTLFSVLKDNIRCVILNACYSELQAYAIAQHIDVVVGMNSAIGDMAAKNFAAAFYQGLGYGRSVKTAFDLGCSMIDLANLDEQDTPQLLALSENPSQIFFVGAVQ